MAASTGLTTADTRGRPMHACPRRRGRPRRYRAKSVRIPLGWRLVERAAAQIIRTVTVHLSPARSHATTRSTLDAGHYAWEQAPEDYGRLVVEWIAGGSGGVGDG